MPLYVYRDEKTGNEVEVVRSVARMEVPPSETEAADFGMTVEEWAVALWSRVVRGSVPFFRGPSWGAGKGRW